jgi:ribonuclease HI
MRVFTDGSCTLNGRPGSKSGFAVWFPEHRELSMSARVPNDQPQTNQRAELSAIHSAVCILDAHGFVDEDIVIYTDSDYCINCFTKWIPGWISRGWKTSEGKEVLHQDLIKETSAKLSKFKSHRFVHVRAHTGHEDDLSKNNDIVDRMARATVDDTVRIVEPPALDDLYPGCPLRVMGPPVTVTETTEWMRANLGVLERAVVDKYLLKAFAELCKARDITITKQTIQKRTMLRAERSNLQISHSIKVEKLDE